MLLITEVILNYEIFLRLIPFLALKVMIHPKIKIVLLTLFIQLIIKEYILRNVSVFLSIQWKSNVWFPAFFKIYFYVQQRKSYSQVIITFLSAKKKKKFGNADRIKLGGVSLTISYAYAL